MLTVLSAGLLAWVPFAHAAHRLNNAVLKRRAALYGGLAVILVVLIMATPTNAEGDPIGATGNALNTATGMLAMAVIVIALIQQWPLRHTAFIAADAYATPRAPDPAIAAVLATRQRREQARALATDDPLMARELRIGRPDLSRTYDDGGLVDLNTAPADVIARICDLDPATAEAIVVARGSHGFTNIDEVLVTVELPVTRWDRIRDRAILIRA